MIIRKPYAFLIKNFRKIHIALLVLGAFVFYKTIRTALFVSEFMNYGIYDAYANPISKIISPIFRFSVILMFVGSASILLLLRHKQKPWKSYIFPTALYLFLFLVLGMIRSFFNVYTEMLETTNLRLSGDLLLIFLFCQLPAIAIFLMRTIGIDIKSFNFAKDLDSLELSDEDREEIEIGLNVDVYTFVRLGRRFWRNLGYFYQEHKRMCFVVIAILSIFFIKNTYQLIFVHNKTYRPGQLYSVNGYNISITNAYITDRDNTGKVISDDSRFVIVEFKVKNNDETRNLNTSYFHLRAGTKDYKTTETTYANEFADIGKTYNKVRKLQKNETSKFIVVYKVDKRIRKGRFVMYYQEQFGIFKLRKLKLKIKDISKVNEAQNLEQGDFFDIKIKDLEDSLAFDSIELTNIVEYKVNKCNSIECYMDKKTYNSPEGYKIIAMEFSSDYFESKNMIDFLSKYGKINYKDNEDKIKSMRIDLALDKDYFGKYVYLKVPDKVASAKEISLVISTRNDIYIYKLI